MGTYLEHICKCADWQHLRERFTDIRRDYKYYMLEDLRQVVAAVRKDINQKLILKAASGLKEDEEKDEAE